MSDQIEIGPFPDEIDGYEQIGIKPLLVGCRCGWQGEDWHLIRVNKHDRDRYCPACGRHFKSALG